MVSILYNLSYLVPLILISVSGGFSYFDYFGHPLGVFCITALTGIFCVIFRHLKSRLKYMLPGCIFVATFAIVLLREQEERILFIRQNRWMAMAVLVAAGCFFLMRLVSSYVWARRGLCVLLLAGLLAILFGNWETEKLAVTAAFFLLLISLTEEVQRYWKKSGYTDRLGHLVYLLPFLLAVSVIVHVIPVSDKPYDWSFAVRIWEKTTENIKLSVSYFHRNDENFANARIGFSDDGRLMGGLFRKNKPVLHLSGKKDAGPVVYLAGMTFDQFDGKEWTVSSGENEKEWTVSSGGNEREQTESSGISAPATTMDALETMCAVRGYDPEYMKNYLWDVKLRIQYDSYHTQYLFLPAKAIVSGGKVDEIDVLQQGGGIVAPQSLGYGTEYEAKFYRVNRDHVVFREFLNEEHEIEESMWDETRLLCGMEDEPGCDYEDYREYKAWIYESYLPITEVTDRVREYMDELLADAESDADKLFRMEAMLRKLDYSDTPGTLPEEILGAGDFLDYFLFDGQQGYCSYFATAFVLMARAEGIPARYVQGYYVRKEDTNEVTVTTNMAHAWPEAYIDGVGWLSFEPTPGYGRTSAWAVKIPAEETAESTGEITADMQAEIQEKIPIPQEDSASTLDNSEKTKEESMFFLQMLLTIVAACILFFVLFLLVNLVLTKRWYKRLNAGKKIQVLFKRNLFLLNVLNYKLGQGETLEEFRIRATAGLQPELLMFLDDYEKILYAKDAPDEDMCMTSEMANKGLLEQIRNTKGRWNYLYCLICNLFR